MNVQDYVKQFEDRKYFAWDRFIPMVFMTTSKRKEIREFMIAGLTEHNKISNERQDETSTTTKIVV